MNASCHIIIHEIILSNMAKQLHVNLEISGKSVFHFLLLLLLLLQRSLLPGGIILQGVLLLQGSMSVFVCHYG
jgi:hypothetical protein